MDEPVTITKQRYDDLIQKEIMLECLEASGVDNWEWYGDAMDEYRKRINEQ